MVMVNEMITITSKTKQQSQQLREGEVVHNYWNENGPVFSFNYYTQQYYFGEKRKSLLKAVRKPKGEREVKINI